MKDLSEQSAAQWKVSTQDLGEALAVSVRERGLVVAVLGRPSGSTPDEVRDWLHDLATVAHEAPPSAERGDQLPTVLRQAISALLFSHSEIWDPQAEGTALSLVLVDQEGEVGIGWAGNGRVVVQRADGGPEPVWVRVVDEDGREGRAWLVPPGVALRVECVWPAGGPDPGAAAGVPAAEPCACLVAEWPGAPAATLAAPGAEVLASRLHEGPPAGLIATGEMGGEVGRTRREEGIETGYFPTRLGAPESGAPPLPGPPALPALPREPFWEAAPVPTPGRPEIVHELWGQPESTWSYTRPEPIAEPAPEPESSAPPEVDAPMTEPEPWVAAPPDAGGLRAAPSAPESDAEWLPVGPRPVEAGFGAEPTSSPAPAAQADPITSLRASLAGPAVPARPNWPSPEQFVRGARLWERKWIVPAAIAVVLVTAAFFFWDSPSRQPAGPPVQAAHPLEGVLAALGWSPDRFDVVITSQPPGASILVDSIALAEMTPARLRLKPGAHTVRLFFPDYGGRTFDIEGKKSETFKLDAALWGSIAVLSAEPEALIQASLDGEPRGTAPLLLDRVSPGAHQLRFSGSGFDPWERTLDVRVGQTREVTASPLRVPGTGILHVRSVSGADEAAPAQTGAQVYVDGELRGKTPFSLELPRGPHSVRVEQGGLAAPVQVVDLPGGNERFLTFDLTTEPSLAMRHRPPDRFPLGPPMVVAATLTGDPAPRVREMWLHVRLPDASYRRYQMTQLAAPRGAAGAVVFPLASPEADGFTRYYISTLTQDGEEHFTEIQRVPFERPTAVAKPR